MGRSIVFGPSFCLLLGDKPKSIINSTNGQAGLLALFTVILIGGLFFLVEVKPYVNLSFKQLSECKAETNFVIEKVCLQMDLVRPTH